MKTYQINEIFYSLQGEGIRAGTPNLFIRFSGCNQKCLVETHGFDCDTEFVSGKKYTPGQLVALAKEIASDVPIIWTGGEPGLQLDSDLILAFKWAGYPYHCIETNGSLSLSEIEEDLDWITVSPKVAEHAIKRKEASEVKYVRGLGQGVPHTVVKADHYLISPAFDGTELDQKTLAHCTQLVKDHPKWRLSVQLHKSWKVR